ncbi:MAG: hypothetical protein OXF88_07205 [Rhodobacteraceae bacterium]|nr:hypothetical protein [Paracoccaceae bacterium]
MTIPDFIAENQVAVGSPLVMVEAANKARATGGVMAPATAEKNVNMCAAKYRNPETEKIRPHQQGRVDKDRDRRQGILITGRIAINIAMNVRSTGT